MREVDANDPRIKRAPKTPAPKPVDYSPKIIALEKEVAMLKAIGEESMRAYKALMLQINQKDPVINVNVPETKPNDQIIEVINNSTQWDFDVKRDHRGLIVSIVATPRRT